MEGSATMNRKELLLSFLKLEKEGYDINSRCRFYNMGADYYPEFPAWKNNVIQFAKKNLQDHTYYQQLMDKLCLARIQVNTIDDILIDMHVISQDNAYWIDEPQQTPSVFSTQALQPSFTINPYSMQQPSMSGSSYKNDSPQIANQSYNIMQKKQRVFIVHGHENEAKIEMARILEKLDFEAIILHEQPNAGRTIIEKITTYTDVAYAVVLYTECDLGRDKNMPVSEERYRARQNVVFEHGYLIARLGREKVSAFVKGDVETPGDISGVVYTKMDSSGAWKQELVREMNASGLNVDFNKLI